MKAHTRACIIIGMAADRRHGKCSSRNSAMKHHHYPKVLSIAITAIALCATMGLAKAEEDITVDGVQRSLSGGSYRRVIVKNGARVTVVGQGLNAQEVYVLTDAVLVVSNLVCNSLTTDSGQCTLSGKLDCGTLMMSGGKVDAMRSDNTVRDLQVLGGELLGHGVWNLQSLVISNATWRVRRIDSTISKSGTLAVRSEVVTIYANGSINGDGAGNDSRGDGADWYANATGGTHAGGGGGGYWGSSHDGKRPPYGSPFTYDAFMGGAGGKYGGAGILIEAEASFQLEGLVTANGDSDVRSNDGGGAGGGILIRSSNLLLKGQLSANGGNGGYYGGGGGGGRIKVFYGNENFAMASAQARVSGGTAGGFLNTQAGGPGSVYRDFIPQVQEILSPADGQLSQDGKVEFRLALKDLTSELDARNELLSPRIELSTDGFASIAYAYDLNTDASGWEKVVYRSGDTAVYTVQTPLPQGVYAWRATIKGQSVTSRSTSPRLFVVKDSSPNQSLSAEMLVTPTVAIWGIVGTRCAIEYREAFALTEAWRTAGIVLITNRPQLFFDTTGLGGGRRFYRLVHLAN